MKGSDLTDKQIESAKQYILCRRAKGNSYHPHDHQQILITWRELVMLVAEYGAIRAQSIARGGSLEEPGEVHFTGKDPR